jgi:hypothetical protein
MYDGHLSNRQSLSKHEIRVFMQQKKQLVLIALFSSIHCQVTIGEILSIEFFKERPEYPNTVRILGINEHFDIDPGQTLPYIVLSITAEPVL